MDTDGFPLGLLLLLIIPKGTRCICSRVGYGRTHRSGASAKIDHDIVGPLVPLVGFLRYQVEAEPPVEVATLAIEMPAYVTLVT